jgi:hypothetical protein
MSKNFDIPNIPDPFNSKTAKVVLELPNYAYSHSSSAENKTKSFFIGRKRLIERLKNLIVSTTSKTGVYLVAGNRGVGKSSLVDHVISETSLPKNKSKKHSTFFIIAPILILGLQYFTNRVQDFAAKQDANIFCLVNILLSGVGLLFLFFIGYKSYLKENHNKRVALITKAIVWVLLLFKVIVKKLLLLPNSSKECDKDIKRVAPITKAIEWVILLFKAIVEELLLLPDSSNPFVRTRNVIKLACILILCHVLACFVYWTHLQVFLCYLLLILLGRFVKFVYKIREQNKSKTKQCIIHKTVNRIWESIRNYLNNYIKNCSRIYLKINFGHDVLKERDILRLITRTLTTEYNEFCHSLRRTFYWRILSLLIIISISYLFYQKIYIPDLHPLIKQSSLYEKSSQHYLDSSQTIFWGTYMDNKTGIKDSAQIGKMIIQIKQFYLYQNISQPYLDSSQTKSFRTYMDSTMKVKDHAQIDKIIIQVDKAINRINGYVYNMPKYLWYKDNKKHTETKPINYVFWLIVFIFYLLGQLLLRSKLFPTPTHYTIKKQLKRLNESITYNIEREINMGGSTGNVSAWGKKKTSRLIADEREIEKELQDILNNVQKIPMFMARPEVVIVFDELDKVSPELLNKNETTEEGKRKETMFAPSSGRERQAVILKVLSNMKYFLSTANAKFIFIAGREMYDMYLADIADRNNYFGSIFNDVIFVPSFLSDTDEQYHHTDLTMATEGRYNITALTEVFVCHHLIPERYSSNEWNLKAYRKYLKDEIYFEIEDTWTVNMKVQKIIAILQQFIVYLAHTSKGAPKKMMQVFESFIINETPQHSIDKQLLVQKYSKTSFFLSFNYYNQFTLGITSYLVSPIIYRLADANIQQHSDKLLVSTLHFVDYMLKFYSQNFSWRQLDISPEVIETNHPPELKAIINDVVTLYGQTHFVKPIISLFDYKFDSPLSHEISFISKMDERFSAQFSFSLDESLALKQYFSNLLKEKQREYEESEGYGKTLIGSISSLQIILGDLHFLDDELEVAALYYKDGMHLLHDKFCEDNLDSFYRLIRNQLKLAYLYEKRKQPEFAYLLYDEIVESLTKIHSRGMTFESLQLFYLPLLAKLQILEKHYWVDVNKSEIERTEEKFQCLISDIKDKDMKIITADFYSKVADILYYKNKIFVEENNENGQGTKSCQNGAEESNKNSQNTKSCQNGIEISHYACKYYKKAFIALVLDKGELENDFDKKTILQILKENNKAFFIYKKTNATYCAVMARVLSDLGDVYFSATEEMCDNCNEEMCDSCNWECKLNCIKKEINEGKKYTTDNFWGNWHKLFTDHDFELNKFLDDSKIDTLNNIELALFLYSLSAKFYKKANMYRQSALQIAKILNCFKLCLESEIEVLGNEIRRFDSGYPNKKTQPHIQYITSRAIEFLYIANDGLDMFEMLKRKKDFDNEASLQYIQVDSEILNIIVLQKEVELYLSMSKKAKLADPTKLNDLYSAYIISQYRINYSVSARVHQLNLKAKLNLETYNIIKKESHDIIHIPIAILRELIKRKVKPRVYYDVLSILAAGDNIWKENSMVWKIFSGENAIKEFKKETKKIIALLEFLVADSIFCYTKILRLIKTSDDSYIFNHRFFADIYRKLADWTEIYNVFKNICNDNDLISALAQHNIDKEVIEKTISTMEKYMEQLLGEGFKEQLLLRYYSQMAFSHYYKSRETHTGGSAYFNLLEQMYFIKGDYDDITSHFNVAEERFMINNTERYKKHLETLKTANEKSSLYKIDNYFEKKTT